MSWLSILAPFSLLCCSRQRLLVSSSIREHYMKCKRTLYTLQGNLLYLCTLKAPCTASTCLQLAKGGNMNPTRVKLSRQRGLRQKATGTAQESRSQGLIRPQLSLLGVPSAAKEHWHRLIPLDSLIQEEAQRCIWKTSKHGNSSSRSAAYDRCRKCHYASRRCTHPWTKPTGFELSQALPVVALDI